MSQPAITRYSDIPSPPSECELCDDLPPEVYCESCPQFFCVGCARDFHAQSYRKEHIRWNLQEEKEKEAAGSEAKKESSPTLPTTATATATGASASTAPSAASPTPPTANPIPPTAATAAESASPPPMCEVCDELPAEVHCPLCKMDLCIAGDCDQQIHAPAKNRSHVRTPIGGDKKPASTPAPVVAPPAAVASPAAAATAAPANSDSAPSAQRPTTPPATKKTDDSATDKPHVDAAPATKDGSSPPAASSGPKPSVAADDEVEIEESYDDDEFHVSDDEGGGKAKASKKTTSPQADDTESIEFEEESASVTAPIVEKKPDEKASPPTERTATTPPTAPATAPIAKSPSTTVPSPTMQPPASLPPSSHAKESDPEAAKAKTDSSAQPKKDDEGNQKGKSPAVDQPAAVSAPTDVKESSGSLSVTPPTAVIKEEETPTKVTPPQLPSKVTPGESSSPSSKAVPTSSHANDAIGNVDNASSASNSKSDSLALTSTPAPAVAPAPKTAAIGETKNDLSPAPPVYAMPSRPRQVARHKAPPPAAAATAEEDDDPFSSPREPAAAQTDSTTAAGTSSPAVAASSTAYSRAASHAGTPRSTSSPRRSQPASPANATPRDDAEDPFGEDEPSRSASSAAAMAATAPAPAAAPATALSILKETTPASAAADDDPFASPAATPGSRPVASPVDESDPFASPRDPTTTTSAPSSVAATPEVKANSRPASPPDTDDDPFATPRTSTPDDRPKQASHSPSPIAAPAAAAAAPSEDDDPFGESPAKTNPVVSEPASPGGASASRDLTPREEAPVAPASPVAADAEEDPFATPRGPAAESASKESPAPTPIQSRSPSNNNTRTNDAPVESDDPFASPAQSPPQSAREDQTPRKTPSPPPSSAPAADEEDPFGASPDKKAESIPPTPREDSAAATPRAESSTDDPFATPRDATSPVSRPVAVASVTVTDDPFASMPPTPHSARSSHSSVDPFGSAASTPRHLDDDEPLFDESLDMPQPAAHAASDRHTEPAVPMLNIKDFMPRKPPQPRPFRTRGDLCAMCERDEAQLFCEECNLALCATRGCDAELHAGELAFHTRGEYDAVRDQLPVRADDDASFAGSSRDAAGPKLPPFDKTTACKVCGESASLYCLDCEIFLCSSACDAGLHRRPDGSDSSRAFQRHHRRTLHGNLRVEDTIESGSSSATSTARPMSYSTSPTCEVCRQADAARQCGSCAMNFCSSCDREWHASEELFADHVREKYTPQSRAALDLPKRAPRSTRTVTSGDDKKKKPHASSDESEEDPELEAMFKRNAPRSSPPPKANARIVSDEDEGDDVEPPQSPTPRSPEPKPDSPVSEKKPPSDPLAATDAVCSQCSDGADVWCTQCKAYFCAHPANEVSRAGGDNDAVPHADPLGLLDAHGHNNCDLHFHNLAAHRRHKRQALAHHVRAQAEIGEYIDEQRTLSKQDLDKRMAARAAERDRIAAERAAKKAARAARRDQDASRMDAAQRARADEDALRSARLAERSEAEHLAYVARAREAIRATDASRRRDADAMRQRQADLDAAHVSLGRREAATRKAERDRALERQRADKYSLESEWRARIADERSKVLAEVEEAKRSAEYKRAVEEARLDRLAVQARRLGVGDAVYAVLESKAHRSRKENAAALADAERATAAAALKDRRERKERERETILEGLVKAREERRDARLAEAEARERHELKQAAEQKKVRDRVRAAAEKAKDAAGPTDKYLPTASKTSGEAQERLAKLATARQKRETARLERGGKKLSSADRAKIQGKKARESMGNTIIDEEQDDDQHSGDKTRRSDDQVSDESENETAPPREKKVSKSNDPFASSSEDESPPPTPKKSTRAPSAARSTAPPPEPMSDEEATAKPPSRSSKAAPAAADPSPRSPRPKAVVPRRPAAPPVDHTKAWGAGKKVNLLGRTLPKTIVTEKEREAARVEEERKAKEKEEKSVQRKERVKGISGDATAALAAATSAARKTKPKEKPNDEKQDDAEPPKVVAPKRAPAAARSSGAPPPAPKEDEKAETPRTEPKNAAAVAFPAGSSSPRRLRFSLSHSYTSPPGRTLPMFQKLLTADLCTALDLPSSQLKVLALASGSIVADFRITSDDADEKAREFVRQAGDETSSLFKGKVTDKTIRGSATILAEDAVSSASLPANPISTASKEKDPFTSDSDPDDDAAHQSTDKEEVGIESDSDDTPPSAAKSIDTLDDSILHSDENENSDSDNDSSVLPSPPAKKKPLDLTKTTSFDPDLLRTSPPAVVIKSGESPLPRSSLSSTMKNKTVRGLLGETITPSATVAEEQSEADALDTEEEESMDAQTIEDEDAHDSDPFSSEGAGNKFGTTMRMPLGQTFKDFVMPKWTAKKVQISTDDDDDENDESSKPQSTTAKFTAKFAVPDEEEEDSTEEAEKTPTSDDEDGRSSPQSAPDSPPPPESKRVSRWSRVKPTDSRHVDADTRYSDDESAAQPPASASSSSTRPSRSRDAKPVHDSTRALSPSTDRSNAASATSERSRSKSASKFRVPAEALGHQRVKHGAPLADDEFPEDEAAKLWPTLHQLQPDIAKQPRRTASTSRTRSTRAHDDDDQESTLSRSHRSSSAVLPSDPDHPDHPDNYHDDTWSAMREVAEFKSSTRKPYTIKGREVDLPFHRRLDADIEKDRERTAAKLGRTTPTSTITGNMTKAAILARSTATDPNKRSMANVALSAMMRGASPQAAGATASGASTPSSARSSSTTRSASSVRSSSTSRTTSNRQAWPTEAKEDARSTTSSRPASPARSRRPSIAGSDRDEADAAATPVELDETHPAVMAAAQKLVAKALSAAASSTPARPVWGARPTAASPPPKALAAAAAKMLQRVASTKGSRVNSTPASETPSAPTSSRSHASTSSNTSSLAAVLAARTHMPPPSTEDIPLVRLPPRRTNVQAAGDVETKSKSFAADPTVASSAVRATPTPSPLGATTPARGSATYDPLSRYPPASPSPPSSSSASTRGATASLARSAPKADVQSMMETIQMEAAALRAAAAHYEALRLNSTAAVTYTPSGQTAPLPMTIGMALAATGPSPQYHPDVPPMVFPASGVQRPAPPPHNPRTPLRTDQPMVARQTRNTIAALAPPGAAPNRYTTGQLDADTAHKQQMRRREISDASKP